MPDSFRLPAAPWSRPCRRTTATAGRAIDGCWVVSSSRIPSRGTRRGRAQRRLRTPEDPWPISAVLGVQLAVELERIEAFRSAGADLGLIVDAIECKVVSAGELAVLDRQIPRHLLRHFEVPPRGPTDPRRSNRRSAWVRKIRTGGTTPELCPAAEELVAFLGAVVEHGVPFKATAGLHHPFHGTYPLTYDDDALPWPMFGFGNLLVAVAELTRTGSTDTALAILADDDRTAFVRDPDAITCRGVRYDSALLAGVRERCFRSFGSCSFREPVDELNLGAAA